ncbi:hypothetical protein L6272_03780 [Microgenomates group bacterium]|nr:hypothetical protein [Microgenomates group bacterium]
MRDRAQEIQIGELRIEAEKVPNANLPTGHALATLFLIGLEQNNNDVGLALRSIDLDIGRKGRLFNDYLAAVCSKKRKLMTPEKNEMLRAVRTAYGWLQTVFREEEPGMIPQVRFPGSGKKKPKGHGPYRDESEF